MESAATHAIGRSVKIDKKIVITTSLRPIFSMEGLRIGNPPGFQEGDFLVMKTAMIKVAVLPLLKRKLHIPEFKVKGLSVNLVENKKGAVNWSPLIRAEHPVETPSKPKQRTEETQWELTSDTVVLSKLVLEDISVDYQEPGMAEPDRFEIEKCTGAMRAGKPFT